MNLNLEQRYRDLQARTRNSLFNLTGRVGIDAQPDHSLFIYHLAQRLRRCDVYSAQSAAGTLAPLSAIPILDLVPASLQAVVRYHEKQALKGEAMINDYISDNYPDDLAKRRAYNIGHAVNDLISKATYPQRPVMLFTVYNFSGQLIEGWAKRWRHELS